MGSSASLLVGAGVWATCTEVVASVHHGFASHTPRVVFRPLCRTGFHPIPSVRERVEHGERLRSLFPVDADPCPGDFSLGEGYYTANQVEYGHHPRNVEEHIIETPGYF